MRNSEKPNRTRCPEHPRREDRKTAMFKKNQDQKLSYKALNNSTTQAKGSLWCYFCLYNSNLFFIDDKSYVGVFILAESKERESFSLVPMRNSALAVCILCKPRQTVCVTHITTKIPLTVFLSHELPSSSY